MATTFLNPYTGNFEASLKIEDGGITGVWAMDSDLDIVPVGIVVHLNDPDTDDVCGFCESGHGACIAFTSEEAIARQAAVFDTVEDAFDIEGLNEAMDNFLTEFFYTGRLEITPDGD